MTVYRVKLVPDVSNVNFRRNETIAASTLVATGPSGVCARSSVATHLIVDRYARFENGRGAHYQAVVPTRLVDSRRANGRWSGRLDAGVIAELDFSDLVGLPAEAVAVSLNVTAVHPAENGYAALGRCDQPPQTSTINFSRRTDGRCGCHGGPPWKQGVFVLPWQESLLGRYERLLRPTG